MFHQDFPLAMIGSTTGLTAEARAGTEDHILFITKSPTYRRAYPCTEALTQGDILRLVLAQDGIQMQKMGVTQGGASFRTLQSEAPEEDQCLSPSNYVINYYGAKIESISKSKLDILQRQTDAYSIGYMIYHYFDSVDSPQENDLVFYSNFRIKQHPCVGIFKGGNTVVSKYDSYSPYVFQHEVFFVPAFYGDQAVFYRLKTEPVISEIPLMRPSFSEIPYTILKDFFTYTPSTHTEDLRIEYNVAADRFPQIEALNYIQFSGICYDYAFGKFLNTYVTPPEISMILELNGPILMKYFDITIKPEEGNLAVYYDIKGRPVHYGIVLTENLIESKWGQKSVYRHSYFDVPLVYGHQLKLFKLKLGLSKEMLRANLKLDQERPSKKGLKTPVILKEDETGSRTLLLFSYKKPTLLQSRKKATQIIKKWPPLHPNWR